MASSSSSTSAATTATNGQLTGCVKWFNNKLNYGFVTVLSEGEHHNVDIFVHQSNIKTKRDCFRTLSTGECVQFDIAKTDKGAHPIHAVNVTGFNGNTLHCENSVHRPRFRPQQGGARRPFRPRQAQQEGSNASSTSETASTEQAAETSEAAPSTGTTTTTTTTTRGRGRPGRGRGAKTA